MSSTVFPDFSIEIKQSTNTTENFTRRYFYYCKFNKNKYAIYIYCINIFILEKKFPEYCWSIYSITRPILYSNPDVDSHPSFFFYSLIKTICSRRYYLDYISRSIISNISCRKLITTNPRKCI